MGCNGSGVSKDTEVSKFFKSSTLYDIEMGSSLIYWYHVVSLINLGNPPQIFQSCFNSISNESIN